MKGPGDPGEAILDCLSSQINGMVTSFVMVAAYVDDEGETRIWSDSLTNQRCHQSMGLLSWALAVEQAKAQDCWRED